MLEALCFASPFLPVVAPTRTLALPHTLKSVLSLKNRRLHRLKAAAVVPEDSAVSYSSPTSVFPAEACDTVGGEACDVDMYPEVKLNPEATSSTVRTASEPIDREYFEYDSPKTVFPGEACDDLGGEFCEPEYQRGVY